MTWADETDEDRAAIEAERRIIQAEEQSLRQVKMQPIDEDLDEW